MKCVDEFAYDVQISVVGFSVCLLIFSCLVLVSFLKKTQMFVYTTERERERDIGKRPHPTHVFGTIEDTEEIKTKRTHRS